MAFFAHSKTLLFAITFMCSTQNLGGSLPAKIVVTGHFRARREYHHVVQTKFSLLAQQIVLHGNTHDAMDGRQSWRYHAAVDGRQLNRNLPSIRALCDLRNVCGVPSRVGSFFLFIKRFAQWFEWYKPRHSWRIPPVKSNKK